MPVGEVDYYYNVTGERARELLFLYGSEGEFLIRPSESNPFDHTLSIHRGNRVTHVKLLGRDGIHKLPNGEEFFHLDELVRRITKTTDVLHEGNNIPIKLTTPAIIPNAERIVNVAFDRFFHIDTSGIEAEDLLHDEPNGTFLVRESSSSPGEYALSVKNDDAILHVRIFHDEGQFRIVPKDEFRTLASLIDNYVRTPMVQQSGSSVRLKQPLYTSRFTAACVDERIDCLLKCAKKVGHRDGISEEFDKLQHRKTTFGVMRCKEGRKSENTAKNRYRNIVPYDHTRVILRHERPTSDSNDYVNANIIKVLTFDPFYAEFKGLEKLYIATQGCLRNTVADFWHMVWQENSHVIVMTTKEYERGRLKCFRYWPAMKEEPQTFFTSEQYSVLTIKEQIFGEYVVRVFALSRHRGDEVETRNIHHFQFLGWEDNGSPSSAILIYLKRINECIETSCPSDAGPMVVHCSAGCGRTGSFIVLDILLTKIKLFGPQCAIDIPKTIRMIREQRSTLVQTETQYRFIYRAVSDYIKSLRSSDLPPRQLSALPLNEGPDVESEIEEDPDF